MIGDHEDSGIDSDDPERIAMHNQLERLRDVCFLLPSDSSSSDDETGQWWRIPVLKHCEADMAKVVRVDAEDGIDELDMEHWPPTANPETQPEPTPERASPPLYEVELTASDEDDDTSVLELVIPVQSSRYQRVPTSSPKKVKPKTRKFFSKMLCCLRK